MRTKQQRREQRLRVVDGLKLNRYAAACAVDVKAELTPHEIQMHSNGGLAQGQCAAHVGIPHVRVEVERDAAVVAQPVHGAWRSVGAAVLLRCNTDTVQTSAVVVKRGQGAVITTAAAAVVCGGVKEGRWST